MSLQSNIHLQLKEATNESSQEEVRDDGKVRCITEPEVPKCEVCHRIIITLDSYNTDTGI